MYISTVRHTTANSDLDEERASTQRGADARAPVHLLNFAGFLLVKSEAELRALHGGGPF